MAFRPDANVRCNFLSPASNYGECYDFDYSFFAEILCNALPPINFGQYDPTDCTDQKLAHGTNCTLICDRGFAVKGPASKTCGGKRTGIWSQRNKQPKCVGE